MKEVEYLYTLFMKKSYILVEMRDPKNASKWI